MHVYDVKLAASCQIINVGPAQIDDANALDDGLVQEDVSMNDFRSVVPACPDACVV